MFDKIPIDPFVADNFIADGIGHGQVGLGSEQDGSVRRLAGARGAGGKIDDLDMPLAFTIGEHSGKEDRMHFGHVVAPGDKDIGMIDVVIAAHGFV